MEMMGTFLAGDVSIDFSDDSATVWDEQATGKVFRRFYAQPDLEISPR